MCDKNISGLRRKKIFTKTDPIRGGRRSFYNILESVELCHNTGI